MAGNPSPPNGDNTQTADNLLSKYINWLEVNQPLGPDAFNAGITVVGYTDPFIMHCNSYNPIQNVTSAESVNDNNGAMVYLPEPNGTNNKCGTTFPIPSGTTAPSPSETPQYGSFYGNPASTALQQSQQTIEHNFTSVPDPPSYNLKVLIQPDDVWGYSVFRTDDAGFYGENSFAMCAGIPTYAQYQQGCQQPVLTGNHYFDSVMSPQWLYAVQSLYNSLTYKSVFNDDTDPRYADYFTPNVIGGQCETCLSVDQYNNAYWPENTYQNHLNAAIVNQGLGRYIHYFRMDTRTQADEDMDFASILLVMQNPNLIMVSEEILGTAHAQAGYASDQVYISPWFYFTATQPIGANITFTPAQWQPGTYNPNSPPTNVGVALLKTSTGAYAREYRQCYIKATAISGNICAAITNPTNNTVNLPKLTQTYGHYVVVGGHGVVTEFSDTGTIGISTATPPPTLAAHSGIVLVK